MVDVEQVRGLARQVSGLAERTRATAGRTRANGRVDWVSVAADEWRRTLSGCSRDVDGTALGPFLTGQRETLDYVLDRPGAGRATPTGRLPTPPCPTLPEQTPLLSPRRPP